MRPFLTRLFSAWPLALLISLLIYGNALKYQWLSSIDLRVYDLGTRMKSTPEGDADVVLIAIDRSSLDRCFPHPAFPISQHVSQHARVIQRLDSAGAALVVLDILFDQIDTTHRERLQEFTSVIGRTNKVIVPGSIETHTLSKLANSQLITETRLLLPPPGIQSAALGIGLADVPVDQDGVIRRCYYGKQFQRQYVPSLAHVAAARYANKEPPAKTPDSAFYIDCSLLDLIARISYERALNGENWQRSVKNKIAIIGLVGNGSIDSYLTPISGRGPSGRLMISGVEIQALAIQTLLSGKSPVPMSFTYAFLLGAALLAAFGLLTRKLNAVLSIVVTVVIMVALVIGGLISVASFSIILPVGALALGVVSTELLILTLNTTLLKNMATRTQALLKDIKTDMTEASAIQQSLQPKALPQGKGFEIGATQITCKEIGGDYYDVIDLGNNKLGILVADVAGKGVAGSLIMANIQGKFRHLVEENLSPAEILGELNTAAVSATTSEHKFITLFHGILDYKNLDLTYSNAGHCYPIICSAQGQTKTVPEGGVPLGLFDNMQWQNYHAGLNHGDVICLYTDGVSEAGGDEPAKQFGEERIADCIKHERLKSVDEIKAYMLESCKRFVKEAKFDDDWTLIIIKLH